jgi:sphingomyelin phosphodiesterase 2
MVARVRCVSGELLTIASLNTRGIPLTGSQLAERAPGVPRTSRFQARPKGALVTRLARPELCVVNTHPVANYDGDLSEANRLYPLHRAQFAVLAHVVNEAGPRAVVCGDFNVSRESALFGDFMAGTGLADAFGGACPPTFRAEDLPAGARPHCIDFILTAGGVTVESTALVFAEKEPLGYVSDHIGLRARLSLSPGR